MRSAARANLKVVDAVPVGASRRYHFHALGEPAEQPVELAEECALALAYNGISQAVMMVSPADLEDFVVGFSLGAGIVEHRGEIYDLRLSGTRSARQAEVEISSRAFWRLKQQRRGLPGTSSCGLCGVEALEQALPRLAPLPPSALPAPGYLNGLRQRIAAFQPLAHDCGAVHCALFMDASGEIRLAREDIGRHNALDKLIGALARQRLEVAGGLAIVTSRCSLELIHKVQRAGIGTLVSLSAPTGLAARWAQQHNLNLIHLPHHSEPRVYSPAEPGA
ncbi:formate dehydrogenase accessory sulfurtransferase FdhD [Stutzerimonas balearica]|jgi:FdhD protein|uniref:formate dehydrogenase accessory sulfurtransferase FdhD n=2 Tax=Stutzerimonas balearica TaxID=74829 RepID=UPI00190B50DF|nr:formate dehydrogenase accessory sulfurtransferase FdhD [Stutzerimonas balearica]MBK3750065.1 formate dehydrogenase accessory sulfurtransferase FdhD [Stutzerimonas balearica]MBK3828261.1 formate dehydrogenase accessory sulfurtransferase FdhD [Stutzerimonas balearica]MBK3857946.1 formate dehydrogenase accessory sulfurtransferase FdhD [Stutzerimonas balearica]